MLQHIQLYTDGSATTNDRPGGWAYVVITDDVKHSEDSGHAPLASNNDMELQAVIEGLKAVKFLFEQQIYHFGSDPNAIIIPPKITLISDSQLILGWVSGRYSFRQQDKLEKFKELQLLVQLMNVQTEWVKGHSGSEHNGRCDKLANAARLGKEVDEEKPKKKPKKETKVSATFKVTINQELIDGFMREGIRWANQGIYPTGSNDWTTMFIDKVKELMDNGKYFTVERDNDE